MGLLDFLKKNKTDTASTSAPAQNTSRANDAGKPVSSTPPAARDDAEDAAEVSPAEPLAVQPKTVAVPTANSSGEVHRKPEPPATITAYDEFGRQVEVPFAQWREMLGAEMERARDEPERLYNMIVQALQFNLGSDALQAARRLQEIDPDPERSTTVMGIVLMDTGDAADAVQLYANYLAAQEQRGEKLSGIVLTNYAKALVATGEPQAGDEMLWQALEADPNQENGLGWFGSIANERGGRPARLEAMRRAAALPGAWRPQVWLAREALEDRDLESAKTLYREALMRAGRPAPVVLLQSMSGDLGSAGFAQEALALTLPTYEAKVHGLPVGNNLIKASLDLGQREQAQTLVEELQAQSRPEWTQPLQFWETEVRRATLAAQGPLSRAQPEVTALAIEGPVWLPAASPARALFGEPRRGKLLFLAASVGYAEQPAALQGMLPDAQGRLSRALPLFLSESAFLHMGVDAAAIVPWVTGHGFAVMGNEWSDADAAEYARQDGAAAAVALHIQQTGDQTEVRMRVIPAAPAEGAEPVRTVSLPVDWTQAGTAAVQLWSQMAHALLQLTAVEGEQTPVDAARYRIPAGAALGNYLLRLEQLLAVRCAGSEQPGRSFLSGEREIVRGQLDLALTMPDSLPLRLMLHETLLRLRDLRPEVVREVRGPVELLQARHPLADAAAQAVLERQLRLLYPGA